MPGKPTSQTPAPSPGSGAPELPSVDLTDDYLAELEAKHGVDAETTDNAVAEAKAEAEAGLNNRGPKPIKKAPVEGETTDDPDEDEESEGIKPAAKDGDDTTEDDAGEELPDGVTVEQFESAEEILLKDGFTQDVIDSLDGDRVMSLAEKLTKAAEAGETKPDAKGDAPSGLDSIELPDLPQAVIDEIGDSPSSALHDYVRQSVIAAIRPLLAEATKIANLAGNSLSELARMKLTPDFDELKDDKTFATVVERMQTLDATKFATMEAMMRAAVGGLRADPDQIAHQKGLRRRRERTRARAQPRPPQRKPASKPKPKTADERMDDVLKRSEKLHGVA